MGGHRHIGCTVSDCKRPILLIPAKGCWAGVFGDVTLRLTFNNLMDYSHAPSQESVTVLIDNMPYNWKEPPVWDPGNGTLNLISTHPDPTTSLKVSYDGSDPLFRDATGKPVSRFSNYNVFQKC